MANNSLIQGINDLLSGLLHTLLAILAVPIDLAKALFRTVADLIGNVGAFVASNIVLIGVVAAILFVLNSTRAGQKAKAKAR